MDSAIRISLEDVVYAAIELPVGEYGSLNVFQFIAQIGHISEDGVWFEVFVSLKANFEDHTTTTLPAEYRPVVLEQEDSPDGVGKVTQIQIVRIKRKHILRFVPSKRDSFDLVHSLRTPCLRGKLVRFWATDSKTGKSSNVIGRVIADCFRVNIFDRSCKIVPEGNSEEIMRGPHGKYLDRTFVPTRSPSAFNQVSRSEASDRNTSGTRLAGADQVHGDTRPISFKPVDRTSPIVLQYPSPCLDLDGAALYRLEVSTLDYDKRSDVEDFRRVYLDYLQGFVRKNFADLRREVISGTKVQTKMSLPNFNGIVTESNEQELIHAFTKENSFLGGMDQIDVPCLELGPSFLKWNKPFHLSGGEVKNIPNNGDIIYGYAKTLSGKTAARYKRENLCWLNASRVPGLDGFIKFLQEADASGGQNTFNPVTVLGSQGEPTIFSNLLFGYFNPTRANSLQFRWIMENVFWYYKF